MLALLIPVLGKTGLWLSFTGNTFLGLVILMPVMMILSRKNPNAVERLLRLKPHLVQRSPEFEFEIHNTEETAVGVSEQVQNFLKKAGKSPRIASLAALCTEELAVDMLNQLKEHHSVTQEGGKLLECSEWQKRLHTHMCISSILFLLFCDNTGQQNNGNLSAEMIKYRY